MKNRIKELRTALNLTQKELGKKLNIAESTISLYESGKREPDNATLIKLADIFEVSTDYLLHRDKTFEVSAAKITNGRDYEGLSSQSIEKLKSYEAFLRESEK